MEVIDQKGLREKESMCTQDDPPGCMAACPVHIDGRELCRYISYGNFTEARAVFTKSVVFPNIISRICDLQCGNQCKRKELGGDIDLRMLERACMEFGQVKKGRKFLKAKKNKSVAILGSKIMELACAVELAKKGYEVEIYEKSNRLGDDLYSYSPSILTSEVIEKDLEQIEDLKIKVSLNSKIDPKSSEDINLILERHHAVFMDEINRGSFCDNVKQIFTKEKSISPIQCISRGKSSAISIDRFLQNVSMTQGRDTEGSYITKLYTTLDNIPKISKIPPENKKYYTKEEAINEAKRCINCQCLECVKGCEYLREFKIYPKRLVREVYNNLSIVMGNHVANKMINSCSICGQCGVICPNGFDVGEICSMARENMVENGKMPPSAHEFALIDMMCSNSDDFFLAKHQLGFESSKYVFFPGCQLPASEPRLVKEVYKDLCEKLEGGVGLLFACCGSIGKWAERKDLYKNSLDKINKAYRELGCPEIIAACPTCYKILKDELEEDNIKGIWDILENIKNKEEEGKNKTLAIHDACTSRCDKNIQKSVRNLVENLGYKIEEIDYNKDKTTCCGYGGLTSIANKELGDKIINTRIKQSDCDYLTYCINCRDRFLSKGKNSKHLLELFYNFQGNSKNPGISERRYNRLQLKLDMLKDLGEDISVENKYKTKLIINEKLKKELEDKMILYIDIEKTIDYAEENNEKMFDKEKQEYIAYHTIGNVTFWVRYSKDEHGKYVLHNAYSHRMEIEV